MSQISIKTETVIYSRPNGHPLKMTLFREHSAENSARPAVLLIHGGAWTVGSRILPRWYARAFAKAGFVAAAIDYRKMPRYSFPACLEDARAAVGRLRMYADHYGIAPNKIAAMGESAGGHLTLLLVEDVGLEEQEQVKQHAGIQAAVSLYPPTDLDFYLRIPNGGVRGILSSWFMHRFLTIEPDSSTTADMGSPLHNLRAGMCPVLILHGDRDRIVPWQQSKQYCDKSREMGNCVEVITLEGRGHAFDYIHPSLRTVVFRQALSFLQQHLMGIPSSQGNAREMT